MKCEYGCHCKRCAAGIAGVHCDDCWDSQYTNAVEKMREGARELDRIEKEQADTV